MKIIQVAHSVFNRQKYPKTRVAEFDPFWEDVVRFADLTTPQRQAAFLANVGHECSGFTRFEENLFYTTASRLIKIWPSRFRIPMKAEMAIDFRDQDGKRNPYLYIRNPEKLANYVYASRMGNGDEASGDGWRHRGRGAIMNTGRRQYVRLSMSIGDRFGVSFLREPDLLAKPRYALYAAADFWNENNLNTHADKGDLRRITRVVNGGYHGHDDRVLLYQAIVGLLLRERVV